MSQQPDTPSGLIYKAIPQIVAEIAPIAKDRKNKQQGYAFRGVDEVYSCLNKLLAKHKVTIVPVLRDVSEETVSNRSGTRGYRVKVSVTYTLYAEDGSHISAHVPAEGIDYGDKATPKAMSMAYKYMAFQVFCIPVDEGMDTENQSHELVEQDPPPEPKLSTEQKRKEIAKRCKDILPDVLDYLHNGTNRKGEPLLWIEQGQSIADLPAPRVNWIYKNWDGFVDAVDQFVKDKSSSK